MNRYILEYDGRKLALNGEVHEVLGKVNGSAAYRLRSPKGIEHEIPEADFRTFVAQGFVSDTSAGQQEQVLLISGEHQRELRFRSGISREVIRMRDQGVAWSEIHKILRHRYADREEYDWRKKGFPTVRTLQIWLKLWLQGGEPNLLEKSGNSGNYLPRHDHVFDDIVHDLLEKSYIASDRYTIKSLTAEAGSIYTARCEENGMKPSPHGEKVVRTIVKRLPHADIIKARIGGPEGRRAVLQAAEFQTVTAPLERVELDCTVADIFVVDEEWVVLGRPTICAAIDCATGVIVGITVSLEDPNSIMVAKTLKETMTVKDAAFFEKHDIEYPMQTCGRLRVVVTDQGSENSGELIEACLKNASFELRKNIPGQPDRKPFIERFFLELNRFLRTLPGATQTDLIGAKERTKKAQREAQLTCQDLESAIQKWRYDVYARKSRKRIQSALRTREAPYDCWQRLAEEHLIIEPPSRHQLRQMFYLRKGTRKVQRYGIEYEKIQYSSPELREYVKSVGPGQLVDISIDPTDIREIAVSDPTTGHTFFVSAKDPDMPAITFEELKRIRTKLGHDAAQDLSASEILAAISNGHAIKVRKPGTKLKEAKRSAVQKGRTSEIVRNSRRSTSKSESVIEVQLPTRPLERPAILPTVRQRTKS
ncbi:MULTISPECIES: Mu transposase C-terminal domain-containing protein [Rhodobacterales]|uniref:Mu transposase C-terminal domain-containing protein n=1 Tax=Rhodobacterales TaxID=204455 RepID=UPI0015944CE0|nr:MULTISPECIES: Mu transposase C-terminal domain-containing protein [Rhodobacterales]MCD9147192.1 Mu transposase C-terminal domain-containing protein [Pseudophaeobacter flagellatus]